MICRDAGHEESPTQRWEDGNFELSSQDGEGAGTESNHRAVVPAAVLSNETPVDTEVQGASQAAGLWTCRVEREPEDTAAHLWGPTPWCSSPFTAPGLQALQRNWGRENGAFFSSVRVSTKSFSLRVWGTPPSLWPFGQNTAGGLRIAEFAAGA